MIAFGCVVEKFNLFALTLLDTSSLDEATGCWCEARQEMSARFAAWSL